MFATILKTKHTIRGGVEYVIYVIQFGNFDIKKNVEESYYYFINN